MRYLVALFLVALALQPLDLQACAMEGDQFSSNHAAIHDGAGTDCCSVDKSDPASDCEETAHCALLAPGFLVIPAATGFLLTQPEHRYDLGHSDRYCGPPPQALFRPPIA